jgi:transposase
MRGNYTLRRPEHSKNGVVAPEEEEENIPYGYSRVAFLNKWIVLFNPLNPELNPICYLLALLNKINKSCGATAL